MRCRGQLQQGTEVDARDDPPHEYHQRRQTHPESEPADPCAGYQLRPEEEQHTRHHRHHHRTDRGFYSIGAQELQAAPDRPPGCEQLDGGPAEEKCEAHRDVQPRSQVTDGRTDQHRRALTDRRGRVSDRHQKADRQDDAERNGEQQLGS